MGPLAGLKIIDFTRGTAGAFATGMLADYGATVIRVEPLEGDPWRDELKVAYSVYNRGKYGVSLDVHSGAGRARLQELLSGADVLVVSGRPELPSSLGLDFETLHQQLPGLIVASITGFGLDGPYAHVPGYESLVQSLVGTFGEQRGHRDTPNYEGWPFAGVGAGYLTAIAVLAAVHRRAEDSVGRQVETSLYDGALAYLSMLWSDDDVDAPFGSAGARRLVSRAFLAEDGEYFEIHTGAVGAFDRLMEVVGLTEHFQGEDDNVGSWLTDAQREIIEFRLPEIFETKTRKAWLDVLEKADICAMPELYPTQVFDEPQVKHNKMVVEIDDPVLGMVEQVAPAARFGDGTYDTPAPAPTVGQHNDRLDQLIDQQPWHDPRRSPPAVAADVPLLAGVKVLDYGAFYAGPYASRLLADLGADVIKLEPLRGDQLRGLKPPFGSAQAGKRAIAVDLKKTTAQEIGQALGAWADVVQHNMRPGAAERIGLGYEDIKAVNPEVVYAYSPGWGSTGPDRLRQSFAPLVSGYVGINFEVAGRYNQPMFPAGNEDPGNGLLGAVGILIGLLQKQRTGRGTYLEHPQLNAAMVHAGHIVRTADGEAVGAGRLDPLAYGLDALDRLYETDDGWICLYARREDQFAALSTAIAPIAGVVLAAQVEYADAAARAENDDLLASVISDALTKVSTAEALRLLGGAGVPAVEPKQQRNDRDFLRDPENQRTGRAAVIPHAVRGHVGELDKLVRVSDARVPEHRLAPELGEHTDEILRLIGFDESRISALRAEGVVG
ncbi:CoA transferase [Nocardia sp. NPDC005366]|uniref:CaiB/BaiF CoA transferase family protein n=1 Tax=Nocardia sp. NPDC005366 TaxID=3156878 RepID=UPI0033AD3781